jgi:PII-like signaling protein
MTTLRRIEGEQVLLRITVGESRRGERGPLFSQIIDLLRAEGLAGATAVRGIAGFGHDRAVHTDTIEVLAENLPIVIEVVDTAERIDRVVPRLAAAMHGGGVLTTERAHVVRYAKG